MNTEILLKIINKWGVAVQVNKIQEEALELSLVLNQMNCPTKCPVDMEEKLYDELADMKIMMAHAELIFDKQRIDERVEFKLKRMQSRYLKPEHHDS